MNLNHMLLPDALHFPETNLKLLEFVILLGSDITTRAVIHTVY